MVQTIPRTACQPCGEFFAASPVSDFGRCLISAGAVAGRVCADRVFVGRAVAGRNCCSVGCCRIGACCPGGVPGASCAITAAGRNRLLCRKESPQADARGDSLFRASPDSDQVVLLDILEITVGADLQFSSRGCRRASKGLPHTVARRGLSYARGRGSAPA